MRPATAQTLRALRHGASTASSSHLLQTTPLAMRIPIARQFHTSSSLFAKPPPPRRPIETTPQPTSKLRAHNNEQVPSQPPPTDFAAMDVLGATPIPANSIEICTEDGFKLNNTAWISDGSGVLLVGGEAFQWRPWDEPGEKKGRLFNQKGQWDVGTGAFGLLGLIWPRPDLLVLGLGPEIRPLSPEVKRHIASLGMRVEILDTRNAASQFNMLATERGPGEIAGALVPIGWREPKA